MVADNARAPSPKVTVTRDRRPRFDHGRARRLRGCGVALLLSSERRAVYLYRFLQRERQGGWYATFHERPDCEVLSRSLQNGEVFRSRNFGITFCKVRLNWRAASTMPVRSLSNERSQRG